MPWRAIYMQAGVEFGPGAICWTALPQGNFTTALFAAQLNTIAFFFNEMVGLGGYATLVYSYTFKMYTCLQFYR